VATTHETAVSEIVAKTETEIVVNASGIGVNATGDLQGGKSTIDHIEKDLAVIDPGTVEWSAQWAVAWRVATTAVIMMSRWVADSRAPPDTTGADIRRLYIHGQERRELKASFTLPVLLLKSVLYIYVWIDQDLICLIVSLFVCVILCSVGFVV
jgi:hypothetical protein